MSEQEIRDLDSGNKPTTGDDLIQQGILAFQNQDYFEAHDFFEEVWQEMTGFEKILWQAIIQLTISFYHFSSGNRKGALGLAVKASEKLNKLPQTYHPQLVTRLETTAFKWIEIVNTVQPANIPNEILNELNGILAIEFPSRR